MRIRIVADGRVLDGAPLDIVRQMQSLSLGKDSIAITEYVDWLVAQAASLMDVQMRVEGETAEEKARSLISEMLRTKLAEVL